MIDVKKMQEDNEATAQVREDVRKSWGGKAEAPFRVRVPLDTPEQQSNPFAFRDPAEMVTISADRFERLIRTSEIQKNEINDLLEKIGKAWGFINTVAMEWAERGNTIPTYEDLSRMAQILDWREPDGIRRMRERIAAEKEAAKKEKEGANNGEAAD